MRFGRSVPVSPTLRFPVRKSLVKSNFEKFTNLSCHFGDLGITFRLDHRCFEKPSLNGSVVASLSFSRRRTSIMQLYPIPAEDYPEDAIREFADEVIPRLKNWLRGQFAKPDTALLGHEQIIVSWNGSKHEYAQVKFL